MRGDLVSRPIGDVVREARALVDAGVRELLVISQDTSAYGVTSSTAPASSTVGGAHANGRPGEELARLDARVRLHYVYPYPHVDEVLPLMAEAACCRISTFRSSTRTARAARDEATRVRRGEHRAHPRVARRVSRSDDPQHLHRRLPGETEAEFEHLLAFLEEAQLDRVGCFAYSPVEGAAANALADPVPDEVREARRERFMQVQARISAQRLRRRVGSEASVLVDAIEHDRAAGQWRAVTRSAAEAPEVDGVVYVALSGDEQAKAHPPGSEMQVRIVDAGEHDLYAEEVKGEG